MCLISKANKVYTATKNISCYKSMEYDGKRLLSLIMDFRYNLKQKYEKDTFPNYTWVGKSYEAEGYHSYSNVKSINHTIGLIDRAAVECHIPKGSQYIVGSGGDYLSSAIIILRIIKERRYNDILKKIQKEKLEKAAKRKKKLNDKGKTKKRVSKLRRGVKSDK